MPSAGKGPKVLPDRVVKVAAPQDEEYVDNGVANSKYTIINFVPRALFEQFRRLANVYFILMGGLMLLGTYSNVFSTPLGAFTTLFPLAVVLTISMIQEGLADIKRHRADEETNNRLASITSFASGEAESSDAVLWCKIQVGDVIRIGNKQPLPADVVVLASSEDENVAYIETSQIDGETNLKLRRAISYIPHTEGLTQDEVLRKLAQDKGQVVCEPPNMKINSFTGTYNVGEEVLPIDNDNVLLRGSVLRNTQWAVGLVVYTGEDTKLQRNARHAPSKMSRIDLLVNRAIYLIFLCDLILVTISTFLLLDFEDSAFHKMTYVGYYVKGMTPQWAIDALPVGVEWRTKRTTFIEGWLTFLVLYNNFIPISMYVTLEVMTYVQMFYINEDREMYHEELDTPAKARSNIVTDLGQIEYIFSDKTGTLTQNVMRFKRCAVNSRIYGAPILVTEANANVSYVNLSQVNDDAKPESKMDEFLKILSVCHTVVVEREQHEEGVDHVAVAVTDAPSAASDIPMAKIEYQAESPDEKALVEAARDFGYQLINRTTMAITVAVNGLPETWTPLAVNKFDSDRKRMSIVVKDKSGRIRLLCKGADTAMLKFGYCDTSEEFASVDENLRLFAQEGLRTLVLGYRDLTPEEYEAWMGKYRTAAASAKNRDEQMTAVAKEIEKDMRIVGITAIEDKLQDGVPETIADLSAAGIKVCVLTGDKMETAINIGYSCKVLREHMTLLKLESGAPESVEKGLCALYRSVKERLGEPAVPPTKWLGLKRDPARGGILKALHKHFPNEDHSMDPGATPQTHPAEHHEGEEVVVKERPAERPLPQRKPIRVRFTRGVAVSSKLKEATESKSHYAFIMEGPALVTVLGDPALERMLFCIMQSCTAVIACRVSPKQKAQLVKLVKTNVSPVPVTLAIGDGANDVGMIQEAHVGIGVSGNEGQQAVNSSDFAIAQFRFLKRLLLVHGRWNYRRHSKVVLYSFYKNVVLVITLFFFLFYCGFSGTAVYEDNILAGYNFFLGLPIFTLGLFDRDVSADFAMANAWIYVSGRKNLDLNSLQVLKWILSALLHGFFVYFLAVWSQPGGGRYNEATFYTLGLGLYAVLLLTMDYKVLLEFKTILYPAKVQPATDGEPPKSKMACSHCGWSIWVWWGSVLAFFLGTLVYSTMLAFNPAFYDAATVAFGLKSTWLQLALIPVICMIVDGLYYFLVEEYAPGPPQLGREQNWCMPPPPQPAAATVAEMMA